MLGSEVVHQGEDIVDELRAQEVRGLAQRKVETLWAHLSACLRTRSSSRPCGSLTRSGGRLGLGRRSHR